MGCRRHLTAKVIVAWWSAYLSVLHSHHHHHHQSHNREGSRAPQIILQPVFSSFPVLHCPLGLAELQVCPFPDVVFQPLPLSALSSPPFHCALQDGFGHTWWTGKMTIPLQFVSLYDRQQVSVWSSCLLDLGLVFVWIQLPVKIYSLTNFSWSFGQRISGHFSSWHFYRRLHPGILSPGTF